MGRSGKQAKYDQDERDNVELPLLAQLGGMGWQTLHGDIYDSSSTERSSFDEVLLAKRMREALVAINLDADGKPWLTPERAQQVVDRISAMRGPTGLIERNRAFADMLQLGIQIPKDASRGETYDPFVRLIDFEHPERNDFVAIRQFRVNRPGTTDKFLVPDVVCFVNGIPLVVIECKSRHREAPLVAGVEQLRRYANQRGMSEGVERLFAYNQLTIATSGDQARLGTFTAGHRHYARWRTTAPVDEAAVLAELGVDKLTEQQQLVAGVLRPAHLLDIVRNFVIWKEEGGHLIKIGPRYQQYRAVNAAIVRLRTGKAKSATQALDERGGVIWQTQGSGKSLAMVFLVRKIRNDPKLRGMMVVFVTDRRDLQDQLSETAMLTGETLAIASPTKQPPLHGVRRAPLRELLAEKPPGLVFAMIQKYRGADEPTKAGDGNSDALGEVPKPLNESDQILVIADEAHRSHTNSLNARMRAALPNAAHIGFTGTPILAADRRKTTEIFGPFIDKYTLKESEEDEATVPIKYEGRYVKGSVDGAEDLDALVDKWMPDLSQKEREAVLKRYATDASVSEATELIVAKARDMLLHYIDSSMPNGFKGMVVARSRLAAVRYQVALTELLADLVAALDGDAEAAERWSKPDPEFLTRAKPHADRIRKLAAAAVISGAENDPPHGAPDGWEQWTDEAKTRARVEAFKKPLDDPDGGLALLCVKSMLLTGFDAPLVQVMYLDRSMEGAELLQAIARANRTADHKTHGLVVDYVGITAKIDAALGAYRGEPDTEGALKDLREDLPTLEARHARVLKVLTDRGLSLADEDAAVEALVEDTALRTVFADALNAFLQSIDDTLPLPDALKYLPDARKLGHIALRVRNAVRDTDLDAVIADAAPKIRTLIDEHLRSEGVDPTVGPIDLSDPAFDHEVDRHKSKRAKAQVMEHAVRDYLTVLEEKDPARSILLSERLEAILDSYRDRWDELLDALADLKEDATSEKEVAVPGLSRVERPFYELIALRVGHDAEQGVDDRLVEATQAALAIIRAETATVDFWRSEARSDQLRAKLVESLDAYIDDYSAVKRLGDDLRDLAHRLHEELHAS